MEPKPSLKPGSKASRNRYRGGQAGEGNGKFIAEALGQGPPRPAEGFVERTAAGIDFQHGRPAAQLGRQVGHFRPQVGADEQVQHGLGIAMEVEHQIGVAGLNARWLEGFGGATVGGSLVGYYNKLKTGVLDTIMLWPESVVGRKMYEVAPYMLKADLGTVNSKNVTANSKTWKKLQGQVRGQSGLCFNRVWRKTRKVLFLCRFSRNAEF